MFARSAFGPDYRDYHVVLGFMKDRAERISALSDTPLPLTDEVRQQMRSYTQQMRVLLPLLPLERSRGLLDANEISDDEMLRLNLEEHLCTLCKWAKERAEEERHANRANVKETGLKLLTVLPIALALWCLVLAVVKFHAIWPYQVSRWLVTIGAVFLAFQLGSSTWRGIIAFALAVTFNPVAPIHFGDLWTVVDVIAASLFIAISPAINPLIRKLALAQPGK